MKVQHRQVIPDFGPERAKGANAMHGSHIGDRWLSGREAFRNTLSSYPELLAELPEYIVPAPALPYVEQAEVLEPNGRYQAPGVSETVDALSAASVGSVVELRPTTQPPQQVGGELTNVAA